MRPSKFAKRFFKAKSFKNEGGYSLTEGIFFGKSQCRKNRSFPLVSRQMSSKINMSHFKTWKTVFFNRKPQKIDEKFSEEFLFSKFFL